ncbi:MAG TPA: hypothetical protein DCP92_11815 [Nitrospiraceae bacterium]|jgi:hypothetical protein|nr:hypothetical protein [Nitrospiraceae bacterium]
MATLKDIGVRNYCESVFTRLTTMKAELLCYVREIEQMPEPDKEFLKSHIPHFRDIVNTIDWKLEILMKVCPFDWTGYTHDIEYTASVYVDDELIEKEPVLGGYIGG